MAEKIYAVTLHVRESQISTVLAALTGSSTLVSVTPTKESAETNSKSYTRTYAGGKRNKGITGAELAMQIFSAANRPVSYSEIAERFAAHGFAKHSSSPAISKLVKENKVRKLGGGKYVATGVSIRI